MSTLLNPTSGLFKSFTQLRAYFSARFFRFLDKRNPSSSFHKLNTKNLYIFPGKRGFIFLGFVVVLWMLGTNYQNNLILGLSFLLVSIFIVSILHTYANLAGLEIQVKGAANAHVGDVVEFYIGIHNPRKAACDGLSLRWQESTLDDTRIQLESFSTTQAHVPIAAVKRGVLKPKRLLVESEFPLGLLRCWTWLSFDGSALVYPKPIEAPIYQNSVDDEGGDGEHPVKGGDDFNALNKYRDGDSIKRIAWKLYAKDRGLFTKEFSQNVSRELWLDYHQVAAQDVEDKLSALCYWALRLHQEDENFGLILPSSKISPGKGENHKANILESLARFSG